MRPDVAFALPALAGGGVERVYLDLAGAMVKEGLRVDFVLARAEGPLLAQLPQGVRLWDLGVPRRLRLLRAYTPLGVYLAQARPRVVLPVWDYLDWVPLQAAWRSRTPFLWVLHNAPAYLKDVPNPVKRHTALWAARQTLKRAVNHPLGRVGAVSRGVAQAYARFGGVPEERICVLPNPIHVDRVRRLSHENVPLPATPYFLALGRLHPQKGFSLLLEAFSIFAKHHPDVHLLILGEGPERPRLEKLAHTLGLTSRVAFLGFVVNPYPYLRGAKALVITSRYEGFSMVALEALALRVPVVAVESEGGLLEALGDGRFGIVTPRSPQALAHAMERVLSDGFAWDETALKDHLNQYSPEAALRSYMSVLEEIWR